MRAQEIIRDLIDKLESIEAKLGGSVDGSDEEQGVFVPPIQQSIELKKAAVGKDSPVIDQLTSDEEPAATNKPTLNTKVIQTVFDDDEEGPIPQ